MLVPSPTAVSHQREILLYSWNSDGRPPARFSEVLKLCHSRRYTSIGRLKPMWQPSCVIVEAVGWLQHTSSFARLLDSIKFRTPFDTLSMAVIDPHYLWAAGHGIMLFGSAYILLRTVFFRPTPNKVYRLSYTGALLSYTIVVLKSLGRPTLDAAWLRRAFVDENVQYMMLALYWWISKPINSEWGSSIRSPSSSLRSYRLPTGYSPVER